MVDRTAEYVRTNVNNGQLEFVKILISDDNTFSALHNYLVLLGFELETVEYL